MTPDLVWRAWRYRLRVEPAEIAFVRRTLRPGQHAVDIGAHKGGYLYWMRRAVGPSGKVFAFEIQPELVAKLRRAYAGDPAVIVEELGVSDRSGSARANVPSSRAACGATLEPRPDAVRRLEVRTVSLDDYFAARPDVRVALIKCDVEGHEERVFEGAGRILREHRPVLLFECESRHRGGEPIDAVFERLRERGYQGSFFLGGRRQALDSFSPELQRDPRHKPYVNNFIFSPEAVDPPV